MGTRAENNDGTKRKRRNDRNHIVYEITCVPTGHTYIGITVCRGRAHKKSLETRWKGHIYHACVEMRDLPFAATLRHHGASAFSKRILAVVRGKAAAHSTEVELIKTLKPALNLASIVKPSKKTR